MNTKLLEAIYESALDGEITAEQCKAMEEIVMQEKVFTNPIRKFKDTITKIRKERPDEDSDIDTIKKFIDSHYDDMMKTADILEGEPESYRKDEIKTLVGTLGAILGGALLSSVAAIPGTAIVFIGYAGAVVSVICQYIRANDDQTTYNNLIKIRDSLVKISKSEKLDDASAKKVKNMISKIDDVQTEFSSGGVKMTVRKE